MIKLNTEKLTELVDQLDGTNYLIETDDNNILITAYFKEPDKYTQYLTHYWSIPIDAKKIVVESIHKRKCDVSDFKLVTIEEFHQYCKKRIEYDILQSLENDSDNNLKSMVKELEKYGGTYVINGGTEIKKLIAACSTDEDYYYVYLFLDGGELKLEYDTGVSGIIPLIDQLTPRDYSRIKDYMLEQWVNEEYDKIYNFVMDKFIISHRDVLFTPIFLHNK